MATGARPEQRNRQQRWRGTTSVAQERNSILRLSCTRWCRSTTTVAGWHAEGRAGGVGGAHALGGALCEEHVHQRLVHGQPGGLGKRVGFRTKAGAAAVAHARLHRVDAQLRVLQRACTGSWGCDGVAALVARAHRCGVGGGVCLDGDVQLPLSRGGRAVVATGSRGDVRVQGGVILIVRWLDFKTLEPWHRRCCV